MGATRQLKQQITDLLMNDKSILNLIAEVVSLTIIDKLSHSEATIQKVAVNIVQNTEFVKSVTSKLGNQKDAIKQELYESILFDSSEDKNKIKQLEELCNELQRKNKDFEWELESLEQFGRRNCLLIHGVAERSNELTEDTDAIAIDIVRNKLGLEIDRTQLDRLHRLWRRNISQTRPKPRPILLKFVSYNVRSEVFRRKRRLKGSGLGVTESLTRKRMELYSTVNNHSNVSSAWTLDGRIIALRNDQRKIIVESPKDLSKL
jgi:hypothetical protein